MEGSQNEERLTIKCCKVDFLVQRNTIDLHDPSLELTDSVTERSKLGKTNKKSSLEMLYLYMYIIIISYSKIKMFTVFMFIAFKVKANTCM